MGISEGSLRDILMMDCLPNSIGLLLDKAADVNNNDNPSDKDSYKYFQPVLHRGQRIPCTNYCILELEKYNQTDVSLFIYEEDCEIDETTASDSNDEVKLRFDGRSTYILIYYSHIYALFRLITTVSLPIEINYKAEKHEPKVIIIFSVSANGCLAVSVESFSAEALNDIKYTDSHQMGQSNQPKEASSMIFLVFYLFLLILVYLFFKLNFHIQADSAGSGEL
jgi:molecular chaperone DnaK (HSP70)